MKKSTVAIGVIAALGIVWVGGSWYTGKTAEAEYQNQIAIANKQLGLLFSSAPVEAKIDNVKFSRGFFSSDMAYEITLKSLGEEKVWSVPFEGKLYHGPFPLNRVSQFDFSPAILSANSQIVKNAQTQPWFDAAGGKNPAMVSATMSYSQRVKGELEFAPGKFDAKEHGTDLTWAAGKLVYDTDKNGSGSYKFEAKNFNFLFNQDYIAKTAISEDEPEVLKAMELGFSDIDLILDLKPTTLPNIVVGKGNGKLGNFNVSYVYTDESGVPPSKFVLNNWKYDYAADQKGEFLDYSMNSVAESMTINERNLGKLDFAMQMNHLSAAAMNRLAVMDPNDTKAIEQGGLELLQNQPQFVIKPLKLTNESGEINADLNINVASADFGLAMQGKVLSLFKELSFNFNADKAALTTLFSIAEQMSGTTKEDAEKLAQAEVEQLISEGVQQQAIIDNGKSISTSLVLENNELKFNGNVIPEEHIGMFLLGLMMSQ